jgi:TatD-related deoxyribonuclease
MNDLGTPVLDNHLHLDRENQGLEAVKDFHRLGGTHLLVVNKPSWHLDVEAETGEDFRAVFEETIALVEEASEVLRGRAWPVLGVHPGLVTRLTDERGFEPHEARDLMQDGLSVAAEYVADGDALALKSGRPHYDVSDAVWEASNDVLRHGLDLAAECDCALQLHTETTQDLSDVAQWAAARDVPRERVVKHYATGRLVGGTPSVMSEKEYIEVAIEEGEPFLMETDFVDDADRPGAVLGPKTVPRRVQWLQENGHDDAVAVAHVETPAQIYGIDTQATLDG